ncbi:hypothetical protein GSY69_13275 [Brevibacterium sp. 5221]|uniref:VWA domain-containing protein n=1 Tax=Brevibacterium rongguiense TaxID=2695267 RepID=A0A6N9HBS0_9MICO|nr:hypothetical protein [Brevibacterium rongguiense]MYM20904.1 hypothetical protein [Brevibacterium rongguiense]
MTVYMLNRGARQRVRRGRLTFNVALPVPTAQVWVRTSGGEPVEVREPVPGRVIVPHVEDSLEVGVTNRGAEFPAGSVIHFSVRAEADGQPEPDDIQLGEGIDVSGAESALLLRAVLDGEHAVLELPELPSAQADLSELAAAARVETRRALGGLAAGGAARSLVIAVDASASGRRIEPARLRDALRVLTGFASVVSENREVSAVLLDHRPAAVGFGELAELPEAVRTALAAAPLRSAFAAGAPELARHLPGDAAILLVTDAPPCGLGAADGPARHVVGVAARRAWECDAAGARLPAGSTVIDADELAGRGAAQPAAVLADIIASLLEGIGAGRAAASSAGSQGVRP